MATKLSKAEFETLPDALKAKFKAEGDDAYVLIEEDVEGLKKNKAELLKELKELRERFGDLDPEAARKALEDANKAEDERRRKEGEFDALLESKEKAWKERLDAETQRNQAILANLKAERIKSLAIEKGILPDRVRSATAEGDLENIFEMGDDFALKKVGGIGDAAEIDAVFTGLKEKAPWVFAATTASGSGASGSSNNGQSNAKAMMRTAFDGLDPNAKAAFIREGGTVTD